MVSPFLYFAYFGQVFSLEYICDRYSCPEIWLQDTLCDYACNFEVCNFDSSTTYTDPFDNFISGDCGLLPCIGLTSCTEDLLKNSVCDSECNNLYCGFDLGACGFCYEGCTKSMLADGKCDDECNNVFCNFDYDDCGWCEEGCFSYMIDDGI
jgi:hypothetical protein